MQLGQIQTTQEKIAPEHQRIVFYLKNLGIHVSEYQDILKNSPVELAKAISEFEKIFITYKIRKQDRADWIRKGFEKLRKNHPGHGQKTGIRNRANTGAFSYDTWKRLHILAGVVDYPKSLTAALASKVEVSVKRTRENLTHFKQQGLVCRTREGKADVWEITPKGLTFFSSRCETKLQYELQYNCNPLRKNVPGDLLISNVIHSVRYIYKELTELGWWARTIHKALKRLKLDEIVEKIKEVKASKIENKGAYLFTVLFKRASLDARFYGIYQNLAQKSLDLAEKFRQVCTLQGATLEEGFQLAAAIRTVIKRGKDVVIGDLYGMFSDIRKRADKRSVREKSFWKSTLQLAEGRK